MPERCACEEKLQEGLRAADRALAYHRERLGPLLERLSRLPDMDADETDDEDRGPESALPAVAASASLGG